MLNNPEDESRVAYEWTDDMIDHDIKLMKRQLRMVKKGLCDVAVFNHQDFEADHLYKFVNDTLYRDDDTLPFDIFRIGDYPEDKLFSLEQTLQYLEDHDDKIGYAHTIFDKTDRSVLKEKAIEKLKEFWLKHPDGMIEFG